MGEEKPVLVIMAAGMGSRYGGLKQIDPVDKEGHAIIDFSIYDAIKAGFEKVIFIIKRENESLFREVIGNRIEQYVEVAYVYQELYNEALFTKNFVMPEGRVKPWGTAHAILSCIDEVKGAFAVINADDFYGASSFKLIYDYLISHKDDDKYHFAMVGYKLKNTITENGYVSRGVCKINDSCYLEDIVERTHIELRDGDIAYQSEDETDEWTQISGDSIVSMNFWGFSVEIFKELKRGFLEFLKNDMPKNPLKSEYYIPFAVDDLLKTDKATVKVLITTDKWHGVTYKEDKQSVVESIDKMKKNGIYPEKLLG